MKTAEEIKLLIKDPNGTDEMVQKEVEKLDMTAFTRSELEDILALLQQHHSELYRTWKLEAFLSYM